MPCEASARPVVVVELLGVPGSGKSTIAAALVDLLTARGVRAATMTGAGHAWIARSRVGGLIDAVAPTPIRGAVEWHAFSIVASTATVPFARANPTLTRRVIRQQLRRDVPLRLRLHILRSFQHLCARHRYLTTRHGSIDALVLDDGFVHRSLQLHTSANERADAARIVAYLTEVPAPDLVVHVHASLDTCLRRVRGRGVWRRSRRLSGAQLERYLANAATAAAIAADRARDLGWSVIDIGNDRRSLDELEREVGARVCPLVDPDGRRQPAATAVRA